MKQRITSHNHFMKGISLILLLTFLWGMAYPATRIKDIADIQDVQQIQVIGYSLVVGLDGTGDGRRSLFTQQAVRNMLQRFGLSITDQVYTKNVAAVMVTTNISPYAKPGSRVDVVVSSMGDATSLEGGTLLMTQLLGKDGQVYATAQGNLSVGGVSVKTVGMEQFRKNYTLVGRIPGGAIVERETPLELGANGTLNLLLRDPDFTTASRVSQAIDSVFGQTIAVPLDAATISVNIPQNYQGAGQLVQMMAMLESITVIPDQIARVVINERTGTVVVGGNVRLSAAAVSQGSLTVKINASPVISQPNAFSQGQTVVVPQTQTMVSENEGGNIMVLGEPANVNDLANALNTLKVSPRDIISIFQALKEAGALQAQLTIM